MKTTFLNSCLAAAGLICAPAFSQEAFELSELSISPPRAELSGGDFIMSSFTAGETALAAAGGDFALEAVLTPLPPIVVFGDAEIFLSMTGRQASISWTAPAPGYVLEFSTTVGLAARWEPVEPAPVGNSIIFELDAEGSRFFRLRRP